MATLKTGRWATVPEGLGGESLDVLAFLGSQVQELRLIKGLARGYLVEVKFLFPFSFTQRDFLLFIIAQQLLESGIDNGIPLLVSAKEGRGDRKIAHGEEGRKKEKRRNL